MVSIVTGLAVSWKFVPNKYFTLLVCYLSYVFSQNEIKKKSWDIQGKDPRSQCFLTYHWNLDNLPATFFLNTYKTIHKKVLIFLFLTYLSIKMLFDKENLVTPSYELVNAHLSNQKLTGTYI